MARLRVLIVDDEPIARLGLREMLKADPDLELVGECGSGREATRFLSTNDVDLLLLDIQMPQVSGFDVLAAVPPERHPMVIFTTAHSNHAVRAFDAAALDYVLKPIQEARLLEAVTRAKQRIAERRIGAAGSRVLESLGADGANGPREPALSRIRLRSNHRTWYVEAGDVDRIEAEGYYASVHVSGKSYLLRQSLAEFETQLDPAIFVRIHRSTIVNLQRVREIQTDASARSWVVLSTGDRLPLSRSRKEQLHQALRRSARSPV